MTLLQPATKRRLRATICAVQQTSADRRSKDIRVLAVIIPELELCNIEWHVFFTNFAERADHSPFNQRPETFNRVGVNGADNVLMRGVIDDACVRIASETIVGVEIASP